MFLHRVAEPLGGSLGPDDEVARVGGDEFAVLTRLRPGDDARDRVTELEGGLASIAEITFGWASYPVDGVNALSLCRAADERLYARKMIRDRHRGARAIPLRDAARELAS